MFNKKNILKYLCGFTLVGMVFGFAFQALPARADAVIDTIDVGFNPYDVYAVGNTVYTTETSGLHIRAINAITGTSTLIGLAYVPGRMTSIGTKLYVMHPSTNAITVIDTTTNATSSIALPAGTNSYTPVVYNSLLYVGGINNSTTTIVDTANGNAVTSVVVLRTPSNGVVSGTKIYFANNSTSTVSIIDVGNNNATSSLRNGAIGGTTIFALNGKVYYPTGTTLTTYDTTNNNASSTFFIGNTPSAFTNIGNTIYVTLYQALKLGIIDTANGNATSSTPTRGGLDVIATVSGKIYMANIDDPLVSSYNPSTGITTDLPVGTEPRGFAIAGTKLYVANSVDTTLSVIETEITPPVISDVSVATSQNGAVITWSTNENASSSISYGSTSGYGTVSTSSGHTSHSVTLSNLLEAATYHYRIFAQDRAGNSATTSDLVFSTTMPAGALNPVRVSGGGANTPIEEVNRIFGIQGNNSPIPGNIVPINPQNPQNVPNLPQFQGPLLGQGIIIKNNAALGAKSPEIIIIQKVLNMNKEFQVALVGAGSPGKETPIFGPATKKAIQKFQLQFGIVKSPFEKGFGVFGPKTKAKFNEILQGKI